MVKRLILFVLFCLPLVPGGPGLWSPAVVWGEVPLLEDVLPGKKEQVQVTILGLEGEALKNVQAALAIPAAMVRKDTLNLLWLKRFEKQTPEKVAAALAPFGYYSTEVTTRLEKTGSNRYLLEVKVDPGEPVRVYELHLEIKGAGANSKRLHRLISEFPLVRGDILRHDLYEEGKGALKSRAIDLGYLDAAFSRHEIRVNRGDLRADIELLLDTGPLYSFGDTHIHGAPHYPERFSNATRHSKRANIFPTPSLDKPNSIFSIRTAFAK